MIIIISNNITLVSQSSAQVLPISSPLSPTMATGTKADGKIVEGEFRYDALRDLQTSNNYQLAVCSENCTSVTPKVMYDASTNIFIGFSTPLDHGVSVTQFFQTDSYDQLKEWFENEEKSNLLNVHMLELLTISKSSSTSFLLGAYRITSKFNSIDVLRRWLWIFERSRISNIRILAFSADCDPKYLRAMRLITGFFAKLPNIPISERNDVLEQSIETNAWISKTDVYPKDRQNFGSCAKISTDDVLFPLNNVSDSYATQVYLRLLRSIIIAYIEKSASIIDRIYHSWMTVFICRLWWTGLQLTDEEKISTEHQDKNKAFFFITKAAYHSIEINAHTLLSVVILVCQHDLPESALCISSFNSQTCENVFRLTRSMPGTFSSNVNFTVGQFLRRAGKLSVLQDIER
ncbi:unnamed protein product [Rotaria socialis]|uniref:Uncharacterized protein n=1 Tax=Rotaria socialis TaxID=392032 RepID=A0A820JV77_9BILA|nr:unnamed protein product [Rotaria socialis]CAF4332406.1 unnamed protein product [Rotaria socialis]